mmetsp:Transcript_569/g.1267  ORF Transcript_569/g.1267 Transcript_569/m.1267 type:complete len:381 (+) Transcript_569:1496-2638(+)
MRGGGGGRWRGRVGGRLDRAPPRQRGLPAGDGLPLAVAALRVPCRDGTGDEHARAGTQRPRSARGGAGGQRRGAGGGRARGAGGAAAGLPRRGRGDRHRLQPQRGGERGAEGARARRRRRPWRVAVPFLHLAQQRPGLLQDAARVGRLLERHPQRRGGLSLLRAHRPRGHRRRRPHGASLDARVRVVAHRGALQRRRLGAELLPGLPRRREAHRGESRRRPPHPPDLWLRRQQGIHREHDGGHEVGGLPRLPCGLAPQGGPAPRCQAARDARERIHVHRPNNRCRPPPSPPDFPLCVQSLALPRKMTVDRRVGKRSAVQCSLYDRRRRDSSCSPLLRPCFGLMVPLGPQLFRLARPLAATGAGARERHGDPSEQLWQPPH